MMTTRTVRLLLVIACAVLLAVVYPIAAAATDEYRGDVGTYCEEGLGVAPYASFTEAHCGDGGCTQEPGYGVVAPIAEAHCGDGGCTREPGFGVYAPYAPYKEASYRGDIGRYCEEGLGCACSYRGDIGRYCEEGLGCARSYRGETGCYCEEGLGCVK